MSRLTSPEDLKARFSFVRGLALGRERMLLIVAFDAATADAVPHSLICQWHRGEWRKGFPRPYYTVGLAPLHEPRRVLALGETGEVTIIGVSGGADEQIRSRTGGPKRRGPLRSVRSIDGVVVAVGVDRQVYIRDVGGNWLPLETGLPEPVTDPEEEVVGFEAVTGVDHSELYAVGLIGEIWHFRESRWVQVPSPTNLILTDVCCAPDGTAFACGQIGTILRGRESRWEIVGRDEIEADFWSCQWYRGHLYLATMNDLFQLTESGGLRDVEFGEDRPGSTLELTTGAGRLWSVGSKDVMAYDGVSWQRIA